MPTPEPATTRALLDDAATALRVAGITDTPRLDAELLLAHAIGVDRTAVIAHGDAPVGADAATTFRALVERRLAGEPVAYQRGVREFHGIALAVDDRVLIPRPETEQLVDLATSEVMTRLTATARGSLAASIRVVDVGTGSGAIAIALAVALRKRGVGPEDVDLVATDISPDALDVARENAVGHAVGDRMRIVAADLLPPTDPDPWDVIMANLPYIATGELAGLGPEVGHEPVIALDGGPDGFDVIRRLLDRLPKALAEGGIALLEIGADQGAAAPGVVEEHLPGWRADVLPDLAGRSRILVVRRS